MSREDAEIQTVSETNHSVEIWHRVMLGMVYSVPFFVATHHLFSPQLNNPAKAGIGICLIGLVALAIFTLRPTREKR